MGELVALVLLSLFVPPLSVLIKRGPGWPLVINICLTVCCFWIAGVVHALVVVFTGDD